MEHDIDGPGHGASRNPETRDRTATRPPNIIPMRCVLFYASWANNSREIRK